MSRENLLEALADRPLLCDGAMGTQLIAAGLSPGASGEGWNLEQPDRVAAIHRRYVDAGCDLVTTNTFQAARTALAMHGLDGQVAGINRAAAELARRAVGDDAWVLGDVGPFGGFLEPMGDVTVDELFDIFTEQIAALYAGGADAVIIETMSDPNESAMAVRAAKALSDKPAIATFAFQKAGDRVLTMMGTDPAAAVSAAFDAGADIVGANCGTGLELDDYARLAELLVDAAGTAPVILQANAGSPVQRNGQTHFPAAPNDMARAVRRFRDAGVGLLGGCCGTTPEHLAAMRRALS
jgi:5-methyltetrahydrofolate--homocysteine methyltransferase